MSTHSRAFRATLLLLASVMLSRVACAADNPAVDTRAIINASANFLHNREPEMTAAEFALHEKLSGMLAVQPDFAITMIEAMMNEKEKPSPAFALILGNAYYTHGKLELAEAAYRGAVAQSPEFLRAWSNLAIVLYNQQKHAEAARAFGKAISLGDRAPTTYGLLGFSLERLGNHVGAEAAYLQAIASDMTVGDWVEGLVRIYIEGKQYARAESLIRQLVESKPREGRFWMLYANVLLGQSKRFEALAVLDTAATLGVADTQALLLLGDLYAEKGLNAEAVSTYASLRLEDARYGAERLVRLGIVLTGLKDFAGASSALDRALKVAPPSGRTSVALALAELALARGDFSAARGLLEELSRSEPMNGRALLALGKAVGGLGDSARACVLLEHATHIQESAYAACVELANLELRLQHHERSLQFASIALGLERSAALEQFVAQLRALIDSKN